MCSREFVRTKAPGIIAAAVVVLAFTAAAAANSLFALRDAGTNARELLIFDTADLTTAKSLGTLDPTFPVVNAIAADPVCTIYGTADIPQIGGCALVRINLEDPFVTAVPDPSPTVTEIGQLPFTEPVVGLDFSADNRLIALVRLGDSTTAIYRLNPSDAGADLLLELPGLMNPLDLAMDPEEPDTAFIVADDDSASLSGAPTELFRVDLVSGAAAALGTVSTPLERRLAIDYSREGNLFGVSADADPSVFNIDPENPASAQAIGVTVSDVIDITAPPINGHIGVCTLWTNGDVDNVGGNLSQNAGGAQIRVADDILLLKDKLYDIKQISVVMAVKNVTDPLVDLEIYRDCAGRPADMPFRVFTDPVIVELGPWQAHPAYTLFQFTYLIDCGFAPDKTDELCRDDAQFCDCDLTEDCFETGYERFWISPAGMSAGYYYWVTAGNPDADPKPRINGVQGQWRENVGMPWVDTTTCGCDMFCADYALTVKGRICELVKDNAPLEDPDSDQPFFDFSAGGSKSWKYLMYESHEIGPRTVDQFQLAPTTKKTAICRIEAYMATNCLPELTRLEIYANDCESPALCPADSGGVKVCPPIVILTNPEVCEVIDPTTGMQQEVDGLPVYCFTWTPEHVTLPPGANYWISAVGVNTGGILLDAQWLFRKPLPGSSGSPEDQCDIMITEAQFRDALFSPFTEFTPISEIIGDPAEQRDMAFRVYMHMPCLPKIEIVDVPQPQGYVAANPRGLGYRPGDMNLDGKVDLTDLKRLISRIDR